MGDGQEILNLLSEAKKMVGMVLTWNILKFIPLRIIGCDSWRNYCAWIHITIFAQPVQVIITFSVAVFVWLIIQLLSKYMFLYGKRRIVLALILGLFSVLFLEITWFTQLS